MATTEERSRAAERRDEQEGTGTLPAAKGQVADERTIEIRDPGPELQMRQTRQDQVRARLAHISVGLFAVAMIFGFVGVITDPDAWDRTKDYLQIIVPVITLLIGGTAGHYFGRHI